jgi:pyridoxamine 5'-phosphate oxidase
VVYYPKSKRPIVDSIENIRTDYTKGSLDEKTMPTNPSVLIAKWIEEAAANGVGDSNAFCLSTLSETGYPCGRIVLARGVSDEGVVFYTNKQSAKGSDISGHSKAGATFFWSEMERQVRVTGIVEHLNDKESDEYFAARPRASQIGAWVSMQSEPMDSRQDLEKRLEEFEKKFDRVDVVPRPPHWGG